MNGVVVVDKPRGVTSFDVVAATRRALGVRRVGHAGTLDPLATGVLPVCVGDATKLVPFLMGGDKEYEAEARLGITTDTLDAEGQVTSERDPAGIDRADVEAALQAFRGAILQRPPMHSALRVNGQRLYDLARQGIEVERVERPIMVHSLTLTAFANPTLSLHIRCGKGTYVRSLVADLGAALGVGAHMTALRRTRVGAFTLATAVTPDALGPTTMLLSPAEALADHAALQLEAAQVRDVRDGKVRVIEALVVPQGAGEHVRLLGPDGSLIAVARVNHGIDEGRLTLARVFC
jgi:tRNA pseudouridine55 synthase